MILSQFQSVGRDLFIRGLISSHSGNLSIRLGERLFITRRGSMLGKLEEHDVVETGLFRNDRATPLASSELDVHRAIYKASGGAAIVHAHCPYAVALSFSCTKIVPRDTEGSALVPEVEVITFGAKTPRDKLASRIAQGVKESRIVVVRGHGTFAAGPLMEDALHWTTCFEDSCRILHLLMTMDKGQQPVRRRKPNLGMVEL